MEGIGPIGHSKYRNEVAIGCVDDGHVIIYGKESAGRYVEIVDVATGKTVGHKRFADDK